MSRLSSFFVMGLVLVGVCTVPSRGLADGDPSVQDEALCRVNCRNHHALAYSKAVVETEGPHLVCACEDQDGELVGRFLLVAGSAYPVSVDGDLEEMLAPKKDEPKQAGPQLPLRPPAQARSLAQACPAQTCNCQVNNQALEQIASATTAIAVLTAVGFVIAGGTVFYTLSH